MKELEIKTKSEWLSQHGDRKFEDLKKDYKGYFVYMGDGNGGEKKIYLPKGLI